ncbi:transferrin-binding protein-like solute binding protein [Yoonia sp. GPGPB17]|uniref:transferrin-binding protein-like solute binding protein n=1 Tax=Yoonia sp. GPGPB17 TaxID=3026147 RepID=UPI0030BE4B0B
MKLHLSSLTVIALSACGDGGSGDSDEGSPDSDPVTYVQIFDATSTETSELSGHELPSGSTTLGLLAGTLDRSADRATVGALSGDINALRTQIDLDGGGIITLDELSTAYVTTFTSQPNAGIPSIGVIGIPTAAGDMPTTGTVTLYADSAGSSIQIIDGSAVYDLTGAVSAEVVFNSNDVDLVFENLNGTRSTGVAAPQPVSDVATITIDDASIAGSVFTGGTATFASTEITSTLSGTQTVQTSGGFFGPEADEIGGVFIIDDTTGATLLIQGTFIVD